MHGAKIKTGIMVSTERIAKLIMEWIPWKKAKEETKGKRGWKE
jgi:hypothetical protein